MKKLIAMLLALAMVFALAACGAPAAKPAEEPAAEQPAAESAEEPAVETRKLTIGHVFAEETPTHQGLLLASQELYEKTNGRFELEIYPNSTYGTYNDCVAAVQTGSLDMCPFDSPTDWLPAAGVILCPYCFESYDHWANFKASDLYNDIRAQISEAIGAVQMDMYNFGFRHVTANKEIKGLDDFSDIIMRCVDFPPYSELAKIFNVSVTAVPAADIYMALQTGVADAEENPLSQILNYKLYEVQDYVMMTKHMLAVSSIIISPALWDTLSEEDQEIFREVFRNYASYQDQCAIDNETALIGTLEEFGMTVIQDVDITPFQERVSLVLENYPEWVEWYNAIQEMR